MSCGPLYSDYVSILPLGLLRHVRGSLDKRRKCRMDIDRSCTTEALRDQPLPMTLWICIQFFQPTSNLPSIHPSNDNHPPLSVYQTSLRPNPLAAQYRSIALSHFSPEPRCPPRTPLRPPACCSPSPAFDSLCHTYQSRPRPEPAFLDSSSAFGSPRPLRIAVRPKLLLLARASLPLFLQNRCQSRLQQLANRSER